MNDKQSERTIDFITGLMIWIGLILVVVCGSIRILGAIGTMLGV